MTNPVASVDGPFGEDVPGMNLEARRSATAFALQACSTFTPSRHGNTRPANGPTVRCVVCHKPQHQHWLRQALDVESFAAALGRIGGRVKSKAKTKAARENAKKGGWPKGRKRKLVGRPKG